MAHAHCMLDNYGYAHTHTHTHTHTDTQNMKYLLFDNNNGDANATHCYVYTHMNFLLLFCGLGARFNRVSAVTVSFFEPERLPCLVLSVARSGDFRHGLGWGLYFKLLLPPSLGLYLHFYFYTTTRRTSG